MAGIAFFFEENDTDVYSGRRIDLDQWYYASQLPGDIDRLLVVNLTDQKLATPNADIHFEVVPLLPPLERAVYLCPHGVESLWEFDHDVDWYVFGPAGGWHGYNCERTLAVPQANNGHCHSAHVMTTVMFHRYKTVHMWQSL
jgi:hypothetical protein